jgi:hypothetical protein
MLLIVLYWPISCHYYVMLLVFYYGSVQLELSVACCIENFHFSVLINIHFIKITAAE